MPARKKISERQMELLLEFVESHPDIALGRFPSGAQCNQLTKQTWESLALRLNAVGAGVCKTADQWRRYWIEWKAKVKAKAADSRRSALGTGGGPSRLIPLSMFEERVLSLIGKVAVEGLPGVRIPLNVPSSSGDTPLPVPDRVTLQPEKDKPALEIDSNTDDNLASSENRPQQHSPSQPTKADHDYCLSSSRPSEQQSHGQSLHSPSARRRRRRIRQDASVPRWVYELEARRMNIEERFIDILERFFERFSSYLDRSESSQSRP